MNLAAARSLLKLPTAFTRAELEQAYQRAKEAWNPAKQAARDALRTKAEEMLPQLDGAKAALMELVGGKNPPRRLDAPHPARPLPAPLPAPVSLPRPEPLLRAVREAVSSPKKAAPGPAEKRPAPAGARLADAARSGLRKVAQAHASPPAPASPPSLSALPPPAEPAPPPLPQPVAADASLPPLPTQPRPRYPAGKPGGKPQLRTPTPRPKSQPPRYGIEIEDKAGCLQTAFLKFGTPFMVLIVVFSVMIGVRACSRPSSTAKKQRQVEYTLRQEALPATAQTKRPSTGAREQRVSVSHPPGNPEFQVEMVIPAKWTAQAISVAGSAGGARDLLLYREAGTWQHSFRVSARPRGEGMGGYAWASKLGVFQVNALLPPELYQELLDARATVAEAKKVLIGGYPGMDVTFEMLQVEQTTTYFSAKRLLIVPVAGHVVTADASIREAHSPTSRAFVRASAKMAKSEHTALFQGMRIVKPPATKPGGVR